jgi:hypothetical protein
MSGIAGAHRVLAVFGINAQNSPSRLLDIIKACGPVAEAGSAEWFATPQGRIKPAGSTGRDSLSNRSRRSMVECDEANCRPPCRHLSEFVFASRDRQIVVSASDSCKATQSYELATGDCLHLGAAAESTYDNFGAVPCRYSIAVLRRWHGADGAARPVRDRS